MKNYLYSLAIACCLMVSIGHAQDIIYKKTGDEIKAKIEDINSEEVKYKKFENQQGPSYFIPKSEVFMVVYENGTKKVFNDTPSKDYSKPKSADYGSKGTPYASKDMFYEGITNVSIGYGWGTFFSLFYTNYNSANSYKNSSTGPLYLKWERGLSDNFSLGINLAYIQYKITYDFQGYTYPSYTTLNYFETDTYTSFSALLRANWHFSQAESIDPYFGLGFGYRYGDVTYTSNIPNGGYSSYYNSSKTTTYKFPFGFETTLGLRVKFSPTIGGFIEAGFAKSAIQAGINFRY